MLLALSLPLTVDIFAQFPRDNKIIRGNCVNDEFEFSITLPDGLNGFLSEIDNSRMGKIVIIQIHPDLGSVEICCPAVDTSPILILLESHPKSMLRTPVPLTGDIYAAIQGYDMKLNIETLGEYQVMTSTLEFEREFRGFSEPIKRIGKFYFINTGDRYLSYGLWATSENYKKYVDEFEKSAKSLRIENTIPVNLDAVFDYPL